MVRVVNSCVVLCYLYVSVLLLQDSMLMNLFSIHVPLNRHAELKLKTLQKDCKTMVRPCGVRCAPCGLVPGTACKVHVRNVSFIMFTFIA